MLITQTPPPLIPRFKYKNSVQVNDPTTGKRHYVTPDGESLPSVTTILSATKDMTFLNEWRKNVGESKAAQITKEASSIGSTMHNNLENFVLGNKRQQGNNLVHVHANKMADIIINNGLVHMQEIWAIEQSLYCPGLYSGTCDGVGIFKNTPVIFDYKQSNKLKKDEYVEDYRLQLVSYSTAHNEIYGTNIRSGIIFMCTRDLEYQQFELKACDYNKYQDMWFSRVEQYYKL